ncbi:hypothetical protein ACCO45_001202 [Purpureocillium lilacinum]|uniref:Uncharacterized protein n=1 Tax=Purpureocillium lilacinum TaxID=33203 RepID=A0ACC4E788_PURLI
MAAGRRERREAAAPGGWSSWKRGRSRPRTVPVWEDSPPASPTTCPKRLFCDSPTVDRDSWPFHQQPRPLSKTSASLSPDALARRFSRAISTATAPLGLFTAMPRGALGRNETMASDPVGRGGGGDGPDGWRRCRGVCCCWCAALPGQAVAREAASANVAALVVPECRIPRHCPKARIQPVASGSTDGLSRFPCPTAMAVVCKGRTTSS